MTATMELRSDKMEVVALETGGKTLGVLGGGKLQMGVNECMSVWCIVHRSYLMTRDMLGSRRV